MKHNTEHDMDGTCEGTGVLECHECDHWEDCPGCDECRKKMQPQGTEARVCDDITERQALGIAKYGKTVAENPLVLREWMQHAYEEALDMAIYLKRTIEQIEKIEAKIREHYEKSLK